MTSRADDTPARGSPAGRAARLLVLTAVLLVVVGMIGVGTSWPLLAATLGPTAYVFAAHPDTETARFRNAVVGHAVAFAAGLAALAAFGLWHHASVVAQGHPDTAQVLAAALAVGATLAALELLHLHHAPAAATAILITTGLAAPGRPLAGLAVGLAIIIILGPATTEAWKRLRGPDRSRTAAP
jgi:hypothetical protein